MEELPYEQLVQLMAHVAVTHRPSLVACAQASRAMLDVCSVGRCKFDPGLKAPPGFKVSSC